MMNKIGVVLGEPNSINSELIAKSWVKLKKNEKNRIFFIGNFLLLKKQLKKLKKKIPLSKDFNLINKNSNKLTIYNVPLIFKKEFKVDKKNSSKYNLNCLKIANDLANRRKILGFINCPINKKNTFGKSNIGVTEYLSKINKLKKPEIMLIFNKELSVVPLTTHLKIKDIPKKINKQLIINKVLALNQIYKKNFKRKPKILLLGLNPHNSEFRKDSEEVKIIIPAVRFLKSKKIDIYGPKPTDMAFSKKNRKIYDVIVGMYHDQVLGPFKSLYDFRAINITLGLKYLRVSPDHGTAEDIICKNKADPTSLIEAIQFMLKSKK